MEVLGEFDCFFNDLIIFDFIVINLSLLDVINRFHIELTWEVSILLGFLDGRINLINGTFARRSFTRNRWRISTWDGSRTGRNGQIRTLRVF
jgi:calcineurin-like phosphoesterase